MTAIKRDILGGTLVALAMVTVFAAGSPGHALLVTFVPGVAAAWAIYLYLTVRGTRLPTPRELLPIFGLTLSVQLLHFAEEFGTGFQGRFGSIYGGGAIADTLFVAFNMASYAVFVVAAGAVVFGQVRVLLVPVLFFAIYGAVGNAVAHLSWAVLAGGYFPGVVTSLPYWVLGPLLLRRVGLGWRPVAVAVAVFGALLLITTISSVNLGMLRSAPG